MNTENAKELKIFKRFLNKSKDSRLKQKFAKLLNIRLIGGTISILNCMLNFWKIDKMKNISHVEKKDYIWIYDSIPAFLKTKVTALMGYSQSSKFTQCKSISYEKFNILNDFAIKYDYKSTNKVGDPVEFDREQMQNYFKALNNYINSVDFQLLSGSEKNRVIDEQVVIHNQLFNE